MTGYLQLLQQQHANLAGLQVHRSLGNSTAFQHKLTSGAHRFNLMVQDFFEDVGPLLSMQLGGKTLEGLFQVFNSDVNMLIKSLPSSMDKEANYEVLGIKLFVWLGMKPNRLHC